MIKLKPEGCLRQACGSTGRWSGCLGPGRALRSKSSGE
jgi:hypothetical protein